MKKRFRIVRTIYGYRVQKKVLGLFWTFAIEPICCKYDKGFYIDYIRRDYHTTAAALDAIERMQEGIVKYRGYKILCALYETGIPSQAKKVYVLLNDITAYSAGYGPIYITAETDLLSIKDIIDKKKARRNDCKQRNKVLEII